MSNDLQIASNNAEETQTIGLQLGQSAEPGDVILMVGELGAGKTTMTQGIAKGLGIQERPCSPTFVMATEYMGRMPLYHLDLYRVEQAAELGEIGLDEYLSGDGMTVIEWADRTPDAYPSGCLWISLEPIDDETRRITFVAKGDRHAILIEAIRALPTIEERR